MNKKIQDHQTEMGDTATISLRIGSLLDGSQQDTSNSVALSFDYLPHTDHVTLSLATGTDGTSHQATPFQAKLHASEMNEMIQWLDRVSSLIARNQHT